jgi:hypothetical protein
MSEPQSAPQCTPEAESGETVRPRVHTQPAGQSTRQRAGNGRINGREVEREYKTRESDTTQLLLRCSTPELFTFTFTLSGGTVHTIQEGVARARYALLRPCRLES